MVFHISPGRWVKWRRSQCVEKSAGKHLLGGGGQSAKNKGGYDMRDLKKNQQPFYYATYNKEIKEYKRNEDGIIENVEIDGEQTAIEIGRTPGYNAPVRFFANISAGKGDAQADVFGSNVDYTRTISTTDMTCQIDELSLIWIEKEPQFNSDGMVNPDSADYKVAAYPAKSLNNIVIAIKKLPKVGN